MIKYYYNWKHKFYRLCSWNPASWLLQIGRKLKKWQWCHNFLAWRHPQIFCSCSVSHFEFSYWFKFHVNIITGFGVMTISFCKGLNRNSEIGNNSVWVLLIIWRLGQFRNIKFGTNVSKKCDWMLQNARVTAVTISELLREN